MGEDFFFFKYYQTDDWTESKKDSVLAEYSAEVKGTPPGVWSSGAVFQPRAEPIVGVA